ncbi:MAG: hypothetical protein ACI9LY_003926 [Arenicella sp.]
MTRTLVCVLSLANLYSLYSGFAYAQQVCEDTAIFAPLLGEWDGYRVADSDKIYVGSLSTGLAVDGCALKQSFTAAETSLEDNFNYESLGFADTAGYWLEVYVLSTGDVRHYRWEQNEEELILKQTKTLGADRNRLVVFNMLEDQYSLLEERSSDRGQTWTAHKLLHLVRKPAQSKAD